MRRVLSVTVVVVWIVGSLVAPAGALITPEGVITGPEDQWQGFANDTYIAWTTNSRRHPGHFDAVARPIGGGSRIKLNARGTEGFPGNFEPGSDRVIIEQCTRRDCGLFFIDVVTRQRTKVPGVNSPSTEWQPKVSDRFILYLRNRHYGGRWYTDVRLHDRDSGGDRRLASFVNSGTDDVTVRTGTVGERYATYMVGRGRKTLSYVYDAEDRSTRQVPRIGAHVWSPAVDESRGLIYVWHSSNSCGHDETLSVLPVSLRGDPIEVVDLPSGVTSGWVSSFASNPDGGLDLYFYRVRCTARQGDIFVAERVDGTQLVSDGGFESPDVGGAAQTFSAGEVIDAWTVELGTVDLVGTWDVPDGHQAIDLAGFEAGGAIAQSIPTASGEAYRIRFSIGANDGCGPGTWSMELSWDGVLVDTFDVATIAGDGPAFDHVQRDVVATTSSTELRFENVTGGSCGVVLDAVRVSRMS